MEALERATTLDRVGDGTTTPTGPSPYASARRSDARSPFGRGPRASGPLLPPEAPQRGDEGGSARLPLVLMASLGAHALFGAVLAILPSVSDVGARQEQIVELVFAPTEIAPMVVPEPVIVPEPEPVITPEPVREAPPEPVVAVRRERAIPEPAPAPVAAAIAPAPSAPPSIDDVFGEPPPALPSLTAAGGGGDFAVAAGSPDGAAGGTPGGRGRTVGASAGTPGQGMGDGVSGPSAEDIRRARRAYANRIRDLLGGVARYPIPARRGGIEGRVVVALRIGDDGRLIAARVRSSCGYAMLDEAALAAANDLSRVPAPPALVAWNTGEELTVPIVFELSR